jgi:hypothetical protein
LLLYLEIALLLLLLYHSLSLFLFLSLSLSLSLPSLQVIEESFSDWARAGFPHNDAYMAVLALHLDGWCTDMAVNEAASLAERVSAMVEPLTTFLIRFPLIHIISQSAQLQPLVEPLLASLQSSGHAVASHEFWTGPNGAGMLSLLGNSTSSATASTASPAMAAAPGPVPEAVDSHGTPTTVSQRQFATIAAHHDRHGVLTYTPSGHVG